MRSRKRWLWLAVPLGVVCAVLAGVAAIVVRELDVERQERRISQVISDFTGREVDIRGGLEIGLSWRPTLVARDVSISNAAWGSQPTMLSADRVEVTLSLERLLSGSIDLVRVALSGVRLLLETDARGARNWDLEAADSDEAAVPLGHDFFAENVVIEDLELRIRGPGSTGDAPIEIPRISVATETFEQPIEFKLRARPAGTEFSATGTIGSLQEWMDGSRVPFALDLRWGGSRFSIEAALAFRAGVAPGGDAAIVQYLHALAVRGGSLLAKALGTEMLPASQTGAMVNVRVPCERAATKDGCGGKLGISTRLFRKYNFYVPFWGLADQGTWVRLSAQIFLELSDFQMVADAIIADLGL